MSTERTQGSGVSRRDFLKLASGLGVGAALADLLLVEPHFFSQAEAAGNADNPLTGVPERGWEKSYRDIFQTDDSYVFLCAPNDTHNCLLRAHTKNGVVTRISPTYGFGQATDLNGNGASHRWDPRCCQKGLALMRRFYGDRRVKYPMVRKGFKEWAEAGFPRDPETGAAKMNTSLRGEDSWVKATWDEAFTLAAKAYMNVAQTYSGDQGAQYLAKQGYDADMIKVMGGAGTRVLKHRGSMALLGAARVFGMYRFANSFALLDTHIRQVEAGKAKGAYHWDSYTWHTDLPPGHPMVTGQQTIDFDLFSAEYAKLITLWGMNWISTKMPDGHWLTEARMKGAKVVVISTDYQSTANKADEVIMLRPGTDAALALGCCQYIIQNKLYDEAAVKNRTDLPLLVRLDTRKLLQARDVIAGYRPAELHNYAQVLKKGETAPSAYKQGEQFIPEDLRQQWDDFMVWDAAAGGPKVVTRDQIGGRFAQTGINPALQGEFEVTLADGNSVKVRPVFDLIKQYLDASFDLKTASELTWVPEAAIESLARQAAANKTSTLFITGVGPNHFFNADLKDRAVILLAALTDNIGHVGGNVGAYAGNYRGSFFNGIVQYVAENPFDIELDAAKSARYKKYYAVESAHFWNYGDRPLKVGNKNFTGKGHMPAPTKTLCYNNGNSLLGNSKWHFDLVHNTLPKMEMIIVQEWWWTNSCEYADIVFPVDSWGEFKHPDMTASVTNPFLYLYPRSPLKRIFDTKGDVEVFAGICRKFAELTGDQRFVDYWRFVDEGKVEVYMQRVLNASSTTRGYQWADLEEKAKQGIPALMHTRTYPRSVGWEQTNEDKPWYNRSGRLEFYRDESEWLEYGENLPVWREPVDATHFEPNVILSNQPHPVISPAGPQEYGLDPNDVSVEVRQVRNIVRSWSELKVSKHPLSAVDDKYRFVFITPKFRHGAHTTPIDLDWMALLFGPFGDVYRHDKRKPWTGEGYVEMNPEDAKALGIQDGDYVWFDADPSDRPYRGWKKEDPYYAVSRGLARARYNNAVLPGVARMWFNMFGATKGSVKGHKERPDGLAKNPETGYQAMFRSGSQQSVTRAWLRPTLLTDSMTRKDLSGQGIGAGFELDVHCANGAPKESFVKIEKAEDGAIGGKGLWRPAAEGLRVSYESEAMKKYLQGSYIKG